MTWPEIEKDLKENSLLVTLFLNEFFELIFLYAVESSITI